MEETNGLTVTSMRKDVRVAVPPTIVSIHKGQTQFFGVGLNLSRSGMFFQTPELVSVGDVVRVKFTLPRTDTSVTCESKVVWCKCFNTMRRGSTHAGVQFVDIDPVAEEYLAELARQMEGHKAH